MVAPDRGITLRALAAGVLVAALLGVGTPYENLIISGSPLSFDYSTPAAVFLFFLFLLFINPLLGLLRRGGFNQAELATVYIMGAVACTVPTLGLVCKLVPHISSGAYYATPENDWAERVLPFIRPWLLVDDEQAVKWFYEGLPRGEQIPWAAWLAPLLAWSPMLVAFFAAMTAMMVLVRRQWVEYERLTFPLVQVPIAMIGDDEKRPGMGVFFRSKVVWIGLLIPVLLYSQRALHNYFPIIPEGMPISQSYYFWNDKFRLRLSLSYAVLGFGYLLSTKLCFSLWFLGLLTMFEHAALHHFGLSGSERVAGSSLGSSNLLYQGCGALLVLAASSMWTARRHLSSIARGFWQGATKEQGAGEILSYRQAGTTLLISFAAMGAWLVLSGISWWLVPLMLVATFALMFGITRVVAEGGLAVTRPPIMPNDLAVAAVGSAALGPINLGALGMTTPWAGEMRTTLMAAVIHGLKLAETYIGRHHKRLFVGIILAAVTGVVTALITVLQLGYQYGAINLSVWFFGLGPSTASYAYTAYHVANPQDSSTAFYTVAGIGALLQVLLTVASARFVWWPIHPVAFPVSAFWTTHHLMPSIFLAWLVKVVVLRYGGVVLYRRTRPFFLGLILGHYVAGGLWSAIDGFTGMTANHLFYW